tara:strand:+ start:64 stop:1152 length:1089 start_codon:yes stop_codon:yes gene_type:complete
METFSLIKLIMGVVFVGVMILTGINNKEPLFMVISSVLLTFGILYGIGLLPYSFFIFVVLGLMMHTYVKSASIEDTLFNVLLIITICLFLGMFGDIDFFKPFRNFKLKEGFWLNPSRQYDHISQSMTAIQCQNACQQQKNCKFAVFPRNIQNGGRGDCWNTKGSDKDQELKGGTDTGYAAWRNKFYEPKKNIISPFNLRWYSRWPNCDNITCGKGTLKEFKQKCSDKSNCDGFSWTKGRNNDNDNGGGCLKYGCKPSQEGRKGFGYGGYGYWLKGYGGKICDERLLGPRQSKYRGCANKTVSGRTCQKWTVQWPHKHTRTPGRYIGKGLGNHNYCRNPDNEPGGIWCYTNDKKKRWEYCRPL